MPVLIAVAVECENCGAVATTYFNPALGPVRGLLRMPVKGWTLTTRPQDNLAFCPDCRAQAIERLGTVVGESVPHEVIE